MKKIFFTLMLIFPILANAQIGESIFSITDDGEIITKSKFLDTLPDQNPSLDWFKILKFELTDSTNIKLPSSTYKIKTGRFEKWDTEPGDYDVIEISKNGEQILLFKELNGIKKCRENLYVDNEYFVVAPLSDSSKILVCEGYQYGTGQPRLMIFVLTESDAKLVYYKEMSFGVRMTPDSFFMPMRSNRAEWSYDRKTIERPAVTHTIWRENGVLKFKDD